MVSDLNFDKAIEVMNHLRYGCDSAGCDCTGNRPRPRSDLRLRLALSKFETNIIIGFGRLCFSS
jgi:hypothetical protein